MKHYNIFLIFFFLLLVLPMVSAAPKPFALVQTEDNGIEIAFPELQKYKTGCDIIMNFDILDENFTRLDNVSASCIYNVVNECGDNILGGDLTYNSSLTYWYFEVPEATGKGAYNYYVYCNHTHPDGSTDGGYVSNAFIIKQGGVDIYTNGSWIGILLGVIAFSIISLVISFNIKDKRLEGLKTLLFLLGMVDSAAIFLITYLITINPVNPTIGEPLMLGFLITHGIVLTAIIWIYALYLVRRSAEVAYDR